MKLSRRGFTLVELMIVIAIIGILAAVLFPSVTRYLVNGRDTNRLSGVNQIVTATSAFMAENQGVAPGAGGNGKCVSDTALKAYLPKFPKDPTATRKHPISGAGCDQNGIYGYGTGTTRNGTIMFAVSAAMEGDKAGTTTGAIEQYQGNIATPATILEDAGTNLVKGAGSGYVVVQ